MAIEALFWYSVGGVLTLVVAEALYPSEDVVNGDSEWVLYVFGFFMWPLLVFLGFFAGFGLALIHTVIFLGRKLRNLVLNLKIPNFNIQVKTNVGKSNRGDTESEQ